MACMLLATLAALSPHDGPGTPTVLLAPGYDAAATEQQRGKKFEAAGEGLRDWLIRENVASKDGTPELHHLFRAHYRARRTEAGGPGPEGASSQSSEHAANGCARTCSSGGRHAPNYIYYADTTRAGLSDRAWVLAHLTALSNALCARPAVKPPYKMLGKPHNGDQSVNTTWWWDRYFSGVESLYKFREYHGTGDCPGVPGRSPIGPSKSVFDVQQHLTQAAAATEPFSWCLKMNLRSYLGAGGFEGTRINTDMPYDWCDMPEAWLGGSEDETSKRNGEMSFGPSNMVERIAYRVTRALELSHWGVTWGNSQQKDESQQTSESQQEDKGGHKTKHVERRAKRKAEESTQQEEPAQQQKGASMPQKEEALQKKCVDAEGKPAWCTAEGATPASNTVLYADAKNATTFRMVKQALETDEDHHPLKKLKKRWDALEQMNEAQKRIAEIKHLEMQNELKKKNALKKEKALKKREALKLQKKKQQREALKNKNALKKQGALKTLKKKIKDRRMIAGKRLSVAHAKSPSGEPCTAHYGRSKPCCDQAELDDRENQDVKACPQMAPICVDYVYHKRYGTCLTESEAQPSPPPPSPTPLAPEQKEASAAPDEGRCTADYGADLPCCGQIDVRDEPDLRPCPESTPICTGYKLGEWAGKCEKPKVHNGEDEDKWIYALHIRRGDTVNKCDTSIGAVLKYMRCPGARFNVTTNHKLVFFTDETSPSYINAVQTTLSSLPRWGGGVVHGDQIVREHMNPEDRGDNYLVYAAASLLMSHADELYSMERCSGQQSCENIRLSVDSRIPLKKQKEEKKQASAAAEQPVEPQIWGGPLDSASEVVWTAPAPTKQEIKEEPWKSGEPGHWGDDGQWVSDGDWTDPAAAAVEQEDQKQPWETGEPGHWGNDGQWVSDTGDEAEQSKKCVPGDYQCEEAIRQRTSQGTLSKEGKQARVHSSPPKVSKSGTPLTADGCRADDLCRCKIFGDCHNGMTTTPTSTYPLHHAAHYCKYYGLCDYADLPEHLRAAEAPGH